MPRCTVTLALLLGAQLHAQPPATHSKAAPARAKPSPARPPITPELATKDAPFVNSLGMKFVPAGTDGVLFCRWETRVKDYAAFAAATKHVVEEPGFAQTGKHPAVNVSWFDAEEFCAWLSQKEGHEYRLPTEAEWSAAAGAPWTEKGAEPTKYVYPWGSTWPPPKGAGNFADVSRNKVIPQFPMIEGGYDDGFPFTAPVGSFTPNLFGLYDMAGNVWEWAGDPLKWKDRADRPNLRGEGFDCYRDNLLESRCCIDREPGGRWDRAGFRVVTVVGASSGR